jgi:hypothetical protein
MAAHKGPASLRPRCIHGGSPVAAMPVYHLHILPNSQIWKCSIISNVVSLFTGNYFCTLLRSTYDCDVAEFT